MTNENLNFNKARYNGAVTVIADQIKQISNLEKKYKAVILEFVEDLRLIRGRKYIFPINSFIEKWEEKLK